MSTQRYLTEAAAAEYLSLAPKTLSRWRWAGKGPAYRKFQNSVRYAVDDLEAFAAAGIVEPYSNCTASKPTGRSYAA